MAKAARRKLKVFQAQLGFYDTVIAAPSQAAALRAWATHQNLFANGQARLADEAEAIKAALAHPETVLRRPIGSSDQFAIEPNGLPKIPAQPKAKAKPKAKPEPPPEPEPDRRLLDAAEAALKRLDEGRKREEAGFRKQQDALDAARESARAAYVADRKAATSAIVEARQAYRKVGGQD